MAMNVMIILAVLCACLPIIRTEEVKMPRKKLDALDLNDEDLKHAGEISRLFVLFGRAVSLSSLLATAKTEKQEDMAIQAADEAWRELAAEVISFALEGDR